MTAVWKADAIVIGGGLFGRIIGDALRSPDRFVMEIDDARDGRGSAAAGCVMKPGWLTSLGEDYRPAMDLLRGLYNVEERTFRAGLLGIEKDVSCHWVNPDDVLKPYAHTGDMKAQAISGNQVLFTQNGQHMRVQAPLIIVAAGIWTGELLPEIRHEIGGKWGASYRTGGRLERDIIRPWAPYKQIVAVNFPEQIWVGDGRALNQYPPFWHESRDRCAMAIRRNHRDLTETVGARPYVAGLKAPALLREVRPGVWAATGGAKNGTAGAAWCALQLTRKLGL